jgi:hypothetical protein
MLSVVVLPSSISTGLSRHLYCTSRFSNVLSGKVFGVVHVSEPRKRSGGRFAGSRSVTCDVSECTQASRRRKEGISFIQYSSKVRVFKLSFSAALESISFLGWCFRLQRAYCCGNYTLYEVRHLPWPNMVKHKEGHFTFDPPTPKKAHASVNPFIVSERCNIEDSGHHRVTQTGQMPLLQNPPEYF